MFEAAIRLPRLVSTRASHVRPYAIVRIGTVFRAGLAHAARKTYLAVGTAHRISIAGGTWEVIWD